jgi:4-amino-4-deoxy-L-arabinose transferase-like glycosyltransferase
VASETLTNGVMRPAPLAAIAAAFAWVAATRLRASIALVIVALACFLPGQSTIPPVDRDEARYAQATTQMLETGDFVDIRLHDEPRHFQPAGIYWLQALSVALLSDAVPGPIWMHRLPSLIGACLVVLLTAWAAGPLGDRRIALLAGLLMAACLLLNVEARLAKTDAVLNAAILACQGVLLRLYFRDRMDRAAPLSWALIFWAALGVGVLVKGPILPLVIGATIIAASLLARSAGWLRGLRPLLGLPLALLIALPWHVAIWFATDGAFYTKALSYSVTDKITTGMQSHGGPPGYYLALFAVTAWPLAAVFVTALPALWRERRSVLVAFLAAWVLPVWLIYELIATKLPHYMLPLYPAIAIACASAIVGGRIDMERIWVRTLLILAAVGPFLFAVGAAVTLYYLQAALPIDVIVLSVLVLCGVVAAVDLIRQHDLLSASLALAAVVAPLTYAAILGAVAPRLETLWLSPRLAAATVAVSGCPNPAVIAAGNNEASLIFAVGTDIRFGDGKEAGAFLGGGGCRAAIVAKAREGDFLAELAARKLTPGPVERVAGINIANGRSLDFGVYGAPQKLGKGAGTVY